MSHCLRCHVNGYLSCGLYELVCIKINKAKKPGIITIFHLLSSLFLSFESLQYSAVQTTHAIVAVQPSLKVVSTKFSHQLQLYCAKFEASQGKTCVPVYLTMLRLLHLVHKSLKTGHKCCSNGSKQDSFWRAQYLQLRINANLVH